MRIQCQFLVIDSKRILTNAQIVVQQGRITELHETPSLQADLSLDQAVILPGFVNSHTHLEFSDLHQPFPAGNSFPEWIAQVVRHRRQLAEGNSLEDLEAMRRQAILAGLSESRKAGVSLMVDIVTQPWRTEWLPSDFASGDGCTRHQPSVIALAEVLGLELQRLVQGGRWAGELIEQFQYRDRHSCCLDVGISPHATYSVLYPGVVEALSGVPSDRLMAMHVAESKEERQWCENGSGPFQEFFQSIGLLNAARRMHIREAIELLSIQERSLLVHGNYLNEDELDMVARANMALVYCPRTHHHFAHREYPLSEILKRDIPMLLGTDSRASNPDLSIWKECKFALDRHRHWSPSAALDAITTSAAQFLGRSDDYGSLDIGRLAWLNVIRAPERATKENLLELLLSRACNSHPLSFDAL